MIWSWMIEWEGIGGKCYTRRERHIAKLKYRPRQIPSRDFRRTDVYLEYRVDMGGLMQ